MKDKSLFQFNYILLLVMSLSFIGMSVYYGSKN